MCLLSNQFIGLLSGIVRIYLPEKGSIKHNPTIDRNLDGLSVLYIKCHTSAVTIVSSEYRDKFSTKLNKLGFHPLFVRIVPKRKYIQRANTPFPIEFHHSKIDRRFPKYLAVIIQIPTLHLVVLQPIIYLLLSTGIIYNAS